MARIKVKAPVVDFGGDGIPCFTRGFIRGKLVLPCLGIGMGCFDLGIEERDRTDGQVTVERGFMTRDQAMLVGPDRKWQTMDDVLGKLNENPGAAMQKVAA